MGTLIPEPPLQVKAPTLKPTPRGAFGHCHGERSGLKLTRLTDLWAGAAIMTYSAQIEQERTAVPPMAIGSIVFSMMLAAIGSGLLFAFIPIKLTAAGFAPWVPGSMIAALALGGFAGCLVASALIRRAGHARIFATMLALVTLSVIALAQGTNPYIWLGTRVIYGFSINILFIVSQSWLHDACNNCWRGRVIATFYMSYILCLGLGSYTIRFLSIDGNGAAMLAMLFFVAAIVPVSLTKLPQPPPPEVAALAVRKVWTYSPTALVGMLAVGGLTMTIQGFAPIYATQSGYGKNDVALLMALMQVGMLFVQLPLGALSDRIDRRMILAFAAVLVAFGAAFGIVSGTGSLVIMIVIFAVVSGANETIYSVSNVLANDRAEKADFVAVSSTLLVVWSISSFVLPIVVTLATGWFGIVSFLWIASAMAAIFGLFVSLRMLQREAVDNADKETFQPTSAQVPFSRELVDPDAEFDEATVS